MKTPCSEVISKRRGCSLSANYEHGGLMYCGRHFPGTKDEIAAQDIARRATAIRQRERALALKMADEMPEMRDQILAGLDCDGGPTDILSLQISHILNRFLHSRGEVGV